MDYTSEIKEMSNRIAFFIKQWLIDKKGLICRNFYGEAFSLAFLERENCLDNLTENILIKTYNEKNKNDPNFHWEFNNYALLDYVSSKKNRIDILNFPLRFKNTKCTNWTLLRCNTKLEINNDMKEEIRLAKKKIIKRQLSSGLIIDDPKVNSFQYHCFSLAMIYEIYEKTDDIFFLDSFIKGSRFIQKFILNNGETLYVGRGQNQSFGYGVLIYVLFISYMLTNDVETLKNIEKVLKFLKAYQRIDGSFPLVLNGIEKIIPDNVDMKDEQFLGWYPYNNYFDYLPFLGFFLNKASLVNLKVCRDNMHIKNKENITYRDKNFIKVEKEKYEAVLSKPGGYWSNDLPIPFIVFENKSITPCYGGEQFQNSLYTEEGIPLPYCRFLKKSIRWRSYSFFIQDRLFIISILGIMKREYQFENNYVQIITKIFSIFKFTHIYLFFDKVNSLCDETKSMIYGGVEYCAKGKIYKYLYKGFKSIIRIKIES